VRSGEREQERYEVRVLLCKNPLVFRGPEEVR